MVSQASEDYLKAIFKLEKENSPVGTRKIAEFLKISSASVTKMLQKLEKQKLVNYTSYQGVRLTKKGTGIALAILRRHRLLELFLKEELGYSWDEVHEEAESLEHHVSDRFVERIAEILGYPEFDPHGDPIPNQKGEFPLRDSTALSLIEPPQRVVICRVPDGDASLLQYLAEIKVVPGQVAQVQDQAPFQGPLTLKIGRKTQIIGRELARKIFVSIERE